MKRTIDAINAACGLVKFCVWPGCNKELWLERVGPLCAGHADLIHEAIELAGFRHRDVIEGVRAERIVQVEADIRAAQAARDDRRDVQGWIYYIQIGERIKVGYATDVRSRMRSYPPGSVVLATHPGTPRVERRMHALLSQWRNAGREWYDPTPEVMAHIDKVVEQYGEPPADHQHNYREPRRFKAG